MHRTRIALCYGMRPQVIEASVLRSRLWTGTSCVLSEGAPEPARAPLVR